MNIDPSQITMHGKFISFKIYFIMLIDKLD